MNDPTDDPPTNPVAESSAGWQRWRAEVDLDGYDERWARLEASGQNPHGEADLVMGYRPATVLDAGCGTGRVGIALAARGVEVVGTDLDDDMLAKARAKAPEIPWVRGNLIDLDLGRRFDVVVLAGNVIPFVGAGQRAAAIAACARHLSATGRLIAGFSLRPDWFTLDRYDAWCAASGLHLSERFATWDREPFAGPGDYAVSIHRPIAGDAGG